MEKLVARLESFVSENEAKPESSQDLAARLREALASNTIGGQRRERSQVARHGGRSAPGAVVLLPPGARAGRNRQGALRALPQGVQPVLRSVPPQGPPQPSAPPRAGGPSGRGSHTLAVTARHEAATKFTKITKVISSCLRDLRDLCRCSRPSRTVSIACREPSPRRWCRLLRGGDLVFRRLSECPSTAR